MSDNSKIEWTDATWNPVTGCNKVNSMSDLFHERVPLDFIKLVFETMIACPQHQFQVLTKRPEQVLKVCGSLDWPEVGRGCPCRHAEVPFFFKQWGGVRKSETERTLNGRTFDEMPVVVKDAGTQVSLSLPFQPTGDGRVLSSAAYLDTLRALTARRDCCDGALPSCGRDRGRATGAAGRDVSGYTELSTLCWADENSRRGASAVPVISVFFGIVIRMFYREHGIAHFHAEHQGQQATFTFDGRVLAGSIGSRTALRLIAEWAAAHGPELETNWERMKAGRSLDRIQPLD